MRTSFWKAALLVASTVAMPAFGQENPEMTFDGLVQIDNGAFQLSWADPDSGLSFANRSFSPFTTGICWPAYSIRRPPASASLGSFTS